MCSAIDVDVERLLCVVKKEVASNNRSSMGLREIGGIHAKKDMHVAGVIGNAVILSGRHVDEYSVSGGEEFLSGVSLLRCDFISNGQDTGVRGAGIV